MAMTWSSASYYAFGKITACAGPVSLDGDSNRVGVVKTDFYLSDKAVALAWQKTAMENEFVSVDGITNCYRSCCTRRDSGIAPGES